MVCIGYLFTLFGIISISNAVKINMQGSLSFGKYLTDKINQYMHQKNDFNARRSMLYDSNKNITIHSIVKSAHLCRNLNLCQNKFKKIVVYYVTTLGEAVTNVFNGLLFDNNGTDAVKSSKGLPKLVAFGETFKRSLKYIKKILNVANNKITDKNEATVWTDIFKRICGKIQETAVSFVMETLSGNGIEKHAAQKKLTQQIVIKTVIVETEYLAKLCSDLKVCSKAYECTEALNTMLSSFKAMDDDKAKTFIHVFYEVLPETTFYSKLNEVTANEFQLVLNDMTYSDNVPTKDILLAIQNTVESRLKSFENNYHIVRGSDVELLNVLLSDMDHIYSKNKAEPFYKNLNDFLNWTKGIGQLQSILRQTMKDISNQISSQSEDLILKLIYEVRVFLEITVDPEK